MKGGKQIAHKGHMVVYSIHNYYVKEKPFEETAFLNLWKEKML